MRGLIGRFFKFLTPGRRQAISWLGSGIVVVVAAIWAVFIHFDRVDSGKDPKQPIIDHSVVVGRDNNGKIENKNGNGGQ